MALTKNRPALGKAGDRPAPTKAGEGPAPTKAGEGATLDPDSGKAVVAAVSMGVTPENRLSVSVSVHRPDGTPITGLSKDKFRLWRMGAYVDQYPIDTAKDNTEKWTLAGWYQLLTEPDSQLNFTGTLALCVQVVQSNKVWGSAMTSVVMVRRP